MNAHVSEELLALFAGGDLTAERKDSVAAHVDSCEPCRARMSEFRSLAARFGGLATEPAEEDLRAVRATIAREISQRQPSRWWPLVWAFGVAATLLVVTYSWRSPIVPLPTAPVRLPELAALPLPSLPQVPLVIVRDKRRAPAAGVRQVSLLEQKDGSSLLKMTTADPNVVILLPLEAREDKHED